MGGLYPELILRLLPILGSLLDGTRAGTIERTEMLLTREVLVQSIGWMNGLVRRSRVLSSILQNDLGTSRMVLTRVAHERKRD